MRRLSMMVLWIVMGWAFAGCAVAPESADDSGRGEELLRTQAACTGYDNCGGPSYCRNDNDCYFDPCTESMCVGGFQCIGHWREDGLSCIGTSRAIGTYIGTCQSGTCVPPP